MKRGRHGLYNAVSSTARVEDDEEEGEEQAEDEVVELSASEVGDGIMVGLI